MSIAFNGSTSLLEYAGSPVTAYPVTLFCWVKPANITQVGGIIGYGEFGAGKELAALQVSEAIRAQTRNGSESNNALSLGVNTTYRPVMVVFASASIRKVYYGDNAVVEDVWVNLSDISTLNRLRLGNRAYDALSPFSGEIAEAAIWSSALGDTEWTSLHGGAAPETVATGSLVDAWSLETQAASQTGVNGRVLTATSTTQGGAHPISRGATSNATATGGTGTSTGLGSGGSATGGTAGAATITMEAIDFTTSELRVSDTGIEVIVNELTGELVTRQTGISSNASGSFSVTHASVISGTWYRCTTIHPDGSWGSWIYQAV